MWTGCRILFTSRCHGDAVNHTCRPSHGTNQRMTLMVPQEMTSSQCTANGHVKHMSEKHSVKTKRSDEHETSSIKLLKKSFILINCAVQYFNCT